jgi:serine/threonine protein phosphatase 1
MINKPWSTFKWEKIKSICDEFRNSNNYELADFIVSKENWVKDLLAMAPIAIGKIEEKLAELILTYGVEDFKKQARHLSYATLIYKANARSLTTEFMQQTLTTPDKWLKVMEDLGIGTKLEALNDSNETTRNNAASRDISAIE